MNNKRVIRLLNYTNILIDHNSNNYKLLSYDFKHKNELDQPSISIYSEIIRSKIIYNLIKIFTYEIIKIKKYIKLNFHKIFKYNKLNELVQKWCWHQYNNKTIQDTVIPYVSNKEYNFSVFISDFNYILNTNIDVSDSLFTNLKRKVTIYLTNSYNIYQKIITNPINISLIISKSATDVIFTVKYNTILDDIFNIYNINKIYNYNILHNAKSLDKIELSINIDLYTHLYNRFIDANKTDNDLNPDKYIFCLVFRYSYIDSGNQQLAINKKIKDMLKTYNVDFELFGSGINVISKYYCSLFYDIEKYFGSQGNFFDIELYQGIYWCNPPYDDTIMTNVAKKIINVLNNNINIAFIITIPIWDQKTKDNNFDKVMKNINIKTKYTDHIDYQIYALLKSYIKYELIIPKKRIPYFNYRLNTPIYAVNTYMLLIYKNIDIQYIQPIINVFDNIIKLDEKDYFII